MTKAVLTDIEGTTSSLSFVKDVLFPYSRARMAEFARAHRNEPEIARLLNDARREAGGAASSDEALIAQLLQWIDEDRKLTPLKALQGYIWESGYRAGHFKGHIYGDAARRLREWHERGLRLFVYSSGSVKAQQLLYAHTELGDLTPLFAGYFDTTIGPKRDTESYRRIAQAVGTPPADIVFLSDIVEELDAARAGGMRTYWLIRAGRIPTRPSHPVARNFDEISL